MQRFTADTWKANVQQSTSCEGITHVGAKHHFPMKCIKYMFPWNWTLEDTEHLQRAKRLSCVRLQLSPWAGSDTPIVKGSEKLTTHTILVFCCSYLWINLSSPVQMPSLPFFLHQLSVNPGIVIDVKPVSSTSWLAMKWRIGTNQCSGRPRSCRIPAHPSASPSLKEQFCGQREH